MTHIVKKILIATCLILTITPPAQAANNPLGYIGEKHNELLSCFLKKPPGPLWPFGAGDECGFKQPLSDKEMQARYGSLVASLASPNANEQARAIQPYLMQLSKKERNYWKKAEAALKTAHSPEIAQKRLARIEQDAVLKLDPKSKGGQAVLAAISTMRSSIEFWAAVGKTQPLARRGGKDNDSGDHVASKWWHGVLADALGGLAGWLLAGPAGAIGLGAASSAAVVARGNPTIDVPSTGAHLIETPIKSTP